MSNNIGGLLTQGGIPATGPQTALNQYTMGEGEVQNAANFANGMGMSTNATQGATGPLAGFAQNQGNASIADTAAQANFLNSSFSNFAGGLGSILGKGGSSGGGSSGGGG
jgi:hypothetical protein